MVDSILEHLTLEPSETELISVQPRSARAWDNLRKTHALASVATESLMRFDLLRYAPFKSKSPRLCHVGCDWDRLFLRTHLTGESLTTLETSGRENIAPP